MSDESVTMRALRASLSQIDTAQLRNYRGTRYSSNDQATSLDTFPLEYRAVFTALYADLHELAKLLEGAPRTVAAPLHSVTERIMRFSFSARRLGAAIVLDDRNSRAVHDIRGGALSALTLELESCEFASQHVEQSRAMAILALDHMKIMRNLLEGIDDGARRSDLLKRPHSLTTLALALQSFLVASGDSSRVVRLEVEDQVVVADSCVEFAALERAAYNLMNNAAAHAGKSRIEVSIGVIGPHLRLAVGNGVDRSTPAILSPKLAADASILFRDFSTTGSGHGLRIVADLVGSAYGVSSLDELVESGYIGTTMMNDSFVAWIHWPILEDSGSSAAA